jgi:hypothetical protein
MWRFKTFATVLGVVLSSGSVAACSDESAPRADYKLPAGSCGYVYAPDDVVAGDITQIATGRDAAACMKRSLQRQRRAVLVISYPDATGLIVNTYRLVDGGHMTLNSARGDAAQGIDGDLACISPKWLPEANC